MNTTSFAGHLDRMEQMDKMVKDLWEAQYALNRAIFYFRDKVEDGEEGLGGIFQHELSDLTKLRDEVANIRSRWTQV